MRPIILVAVLVAACRATPEFTSHPTDIATDTGGNGTILYDADGPSIFAAQCPEGSTLRDRATCRWPTASVPSWGFYHELDAACGADMATLSAKVEDLYVKVARIDDQLLTLINAHPNPAGGDQAAAIATQEAQLAIIDHRVADLNDQIVRLQTALNGSADPDLRSQLLALQADLTTAMAARAAAQSTLDDLRQAYVTANASLLDAETFQGLEGMRQDGVASLKDAQSSLDGEVAARVQCARASKMLSDDGFAYEITDTGAGFAEMRPTAALMGQVFAHIQNTYVFAGTKLTNGVTLVTDVTGRGKLAHFNCFLEPVNSRLCDKMRLTGPGGFDQTIWATSFDLPEEPSAPVLDPLLTMDLTGHWEATAVCSDGSKPTYDGWGCTVQFVSPTNGL